MLNAQGRRVTDMRVLELGDRLLLDVPRGIAAAIRDHLDRFVFSEDVQVEDVSAPLADVGVSGPAALEVLQHAGVEGGAPSELFASARVRLGGSEAWLVRSEEIGIPGYDLIVGTQARNSMIAALAAAGAVQATADDVESVRIERRRPLLGGAMG